VSPLLFCLYLQYLFISSVRGWSCKFRIIYQVASTSRLDERRGGECNYWHLDDSRNWNSHQFAFWRLGSGLFIGVQFWQVSRWIRFATNVLSGVPSIIAGIFAYGIIVVTMGGFSAVAGGVALSVLMLPTIVRTTDEALQIVPQDVRWASVGVGASNYQTVLKIVLPAATPAIITGVTLAIARAAGETAPLIFTALNSPFGHEAFGSRHHPFLF
jgi:ABC-type uncharacterized transport system permease subunit